MMLYLIHFAFFWTDLKLSWFWFLAVLGELNSINIFFFCYTISLFTKKKTIVEMYPIQMFYWSILVIYYLWKNLKTDFWSIFFNCLPIINWQCSLELFFLISKSQTEDMVSLLLTENNNTSAIKLLMQNIVTLASLVIFLVIVEYCQFWYMLFSRHKKFKYLENNTTISNKSKLEKNYELVSDLNWTKQWDTNECLRIRNIVKKFGDYIAVNIVSLDWFKGQIFVLLGHNGAGKTTLINIISGNKKANNGDILFENHSWRDDKEFLYSNIGLCRQENIYFPDLTVYEQIEFFSKLNGINQENKTRTHDYITRLGWKEYADSKACSLSSGNWRKLSVAFALLGNSKIVILDEPTSGMDFQSKKLFWDFLQTEKQNRIIILTTHSMDEAEYWGDNIGIMSEGELICRGSSSFLKTQYPCGYNINFVFFSNSITFTEKSDFIKILRKIEQGMTIKILSKNWIKVNFPESTFHESKINKIFRTIEQVKDKYKIKDYTVSTTSLEEVFFKVNDVDFARNWFENELDEIIKPFSQENNTGNWLFLDEKTRDQQNEKQKCEMNNYQEQGNSFNNLDFESSFQEINLLNNNDNIIMNNNMCKTNLFPKQNLPNNKTQITVNNQKDFSTVIELKHLKFISTNDHIRKHWKRKYIEYKNNILNLIISIPFAFLSSIIPFYPIFLNERFDFVFISNFFPERIKTVYTILNNDKTNSTTKTIKELITMYEPMFSFQKWYLNIDSNKPINYTNITYKTDFGINKNFLLVEYDHTDINYSDFYSLSSPDITHSMLNSIIRKQLFEEYGITTFLFECYTHSSSSLSLILINMLNKNKLSLFVLLNTQNFLSFLGVFIHHEDLKSCAIVLIKLNSGNMYIYWFAMFWSSFTWYSFLTIIFYIFLFIMIANLWYLFLPALFFGIFNIIIIFLILSSNWITYCYLIFSILWPLLHVVFWYKDNVLYLNVVPIMNLLQDFYNIWELFESNNQIPSDFLIQYLKIWSLSMFRFLIQLIIVVLIFWEYEAQVIRMIISRKFFSKKNKEKQLQNLNNNEEGKLISEGCDDSNWSNTNKRTPLIPSNFSINSENGTAIPDIKISKSSQNLALHLSNISVKYKKYFSKHIWAVSKINLELEQNERFALMGLNNSGKTTIIKTIINMVSYNKGFIKFYDYILPWDFNKIRNNIGYCPEQDALFPYLTVFETFDYYYKSDLVDISATNKDVKNRNNYLRNNLDEGNRKKNINEWIYSYGLSIYANVLTKNLSGGNKRKLLLAIALMNHPQLALLDEPTTGVDPDSRRLMWKNISAIQRKNRGLGYNFNWILSTQSIEEAEILCDNVGWLKKGALTYLGNSENWKLQLSEGYYMKICFKKPWMNEISGNYNIYENPNLKNLDDVEGISVLNIDKLIEEKNIEMLYYMFYWDEICGLWLENKTKIKFLEYIENSFRLILIIQSNKGYIFSNILNLKNIHQNISEMNLSMQPFEAFIEDI